jgi:hypothetical protein
VQFVVQSASVADRLSLRVATPQGRRRRPAVGAAQSQPPGGALRDRKRREF